MYRYDLAKTEDEKRAALPLLLDVYEKKGYHSDDTYENSFGKYLLSEHGKVFRAFVNDKLFGTISIVHDSDMGLPMDVLNKKELTVFRTRGQKIAEATQYAVSHEILKQEDHSFNPMKQYTASLPLLQLVIHYAIYKSIDFLCIATTPRHAMFYKTLGFVEMSGKKYYPSVNTWGVAQSLDVASLRNKKGLPGILADTINKKPDYSLFD